MVSWGGLRLWDGMGWKADSFAKTPLKAAQAPLAAARASQGVVRGLVSNGGAVPLSLGDWAPGSGSADMLTLTWLAMDGEAGSGRRLRRMGLGLAITEVKYEVIK